MTTLAPPGCTILEWDSAFWDKTIGRGQLPVQEADECAQALGLDCLYLLVPIEEMGEAHEAVRRGFRLVDVRVQFELKPRPLRNNPRHLVTTDAARFELKRPEERSLDADFYRNVARAYEEAAGRGLNPRQTLARDTGSAPDTVAKWVGEARRREYLPETTQGMVTIGNGTRFHAVEDERRLSEIARSSFRRTRFYNDPRFDDEQCDLLYETWTLNACANDTVLVAEWDGKIDGYVTLSEDGDLVLIAVAAEARQQGIGSSLMRGALDWAFTRRLETLSVVTQGGNLPAQRLFQAQGGRSKSVGLWFHKWFDR